MSAKWTKAEHCIELVVASGDPSKGLETSEAALDSVAAAVELLVVRPRSETSDPGRDCGCEGEIHGELPCFVALVGPIHDEGDLMLGSWKAAQNISARRSVAPPYLTYFNPNEGEALAA